MAKKKETPEERLEKIGKNIAVKRIKLGADNVARVLKNMNNGPEFKKDEINIDRRECIVCTEVDHCAWDCTKIRGPMFQKSWIVTHSKIDGRVAREIIDLFQKRRALSTELGVPEIDDAELSAAESSQVGGSTAAVSTEDRAGTGEGAANPEEPAKTLPTSNEASEEVTEDKKSTALRAANIRMTSSPNMTEEVEPQYPMRKGSCDAIPSAKKTHMTINFYKIDVDPQTIFYEYTILDLPVGQNRRKLKAMVDRMIKHVSILSTNQQFFATDETSTIISWKQLHNTVDSEGIVGDYDVPDGKRRDGSDMTRPLRLKYQRTIDFAELNKYADGKQGSQVFGNPAWRPMLSISWSRRVWTSRMLSVLAPTSSSWLLRPSNWADADRLERCKVTSTQSSLSREESCSTSTSVPAPSTPSRLSANFSLTRRPSGTSFRNGQLSVLFVCVSNMAGVRPPRTENGT
jgi:hypothetical protein